MRTAENWIQKFTMPHVSTLASLVDVVQLTDPIQVCRLLVLIAFIQRDIVPYLIGLHAFFGGGFANDWPFHDPMYLGTYLPIPNVPPTERGCFPGID